MPTPNGDYFVTVDAETTCIPEGIETLDRMRENAEKDLGAPVPITWFVRFQRGWTEDTAQDEPAPIEQKISNLFDGFALSKEKFLDLQDRGDEIGWHYHAYNYVNRTDLDHDTRIAILAADMKKCAAEMRRLHPEFDISSFRFGWFLAPDYCLYSVLREVGIKVDASTPGRRGKNRKFQAAYLDPLPGLPRDYAGVRLFPWEQTILVHDSDVVPHDFGWRSLTEEAADQRSVGFDVQLRQTIEKAQSEGGRFTTYRAAVGTSS